MENQEQSNPDNSARADSVQQESERPVKAESGEGQESRPRGGQERKPFKKEFNKDFKGKGSFSKPGENRSSFGKPGGGRDRQDSRGGGERRDDRDRGDRDRGDRSRNDRNSNDRGRDDRGGRDDRNRFQNRGDRAGGNSRPGSDRPQPPREPEFDSIKNPIFCAMDIPGVEQAQRVAEQVKEYVGGIKVGMEYFVANGAYGVKQLWASRLPLFLDLKFHDIPNTVAGAVRSACALRPYMLTIHLSGGGDMIKAAADAANDYSLKSGKRKPLILGVSVMTSLDDENLAEIGFSGKVLDSAKRLCELGVKNGIDGIVCSAHEIAGLKAEFGGRLKYVVPGIRPMGTADDDQKRVMSPREAIQSGADYLVVGRAITAAPDPKLVAKIIAGQLNAGEIAA